MQTVNVIPWEQQEKHNAFHAYMINIRDTLRAENGFSNGHFEFLYQDVYGKSVPGTFTYMDVIKTANFPIYTSGTRLLKLKLESADRGCVHTAFTDLQHRIADWADSMQHFFDVRFLRDVHGMIKTMGQCLDLRLFVVRTFPNGVTIDEFLDCNVHESFEILWKWIQESEFNVHALDSAWTALCEVAKRVHQHVVDYYMMRAEDSNHPHPWHDSVGKVNVFGTVIQKYLLTNPRFTECLELAPWMHMYHTCVLKGFANQVVVEGMCGFVDRHAQGQRNLEMVTFGKCAIVHYNMPAQSESNKYIKDCLSKYFSKNKRLQTEHFVSVDKDQRQLTTINSEVIDRHLKKNHGCHSCRRY